MRRNRPQKRNGYKIISVRIDTELADKIDAKALERSEQNKSQFIEDICFPSLRNDQGESENPRRPYRSNTVKRTYFFTADFAKMLKSKSGKSMGVYLEKLISSNL